MATTTDAVQKNNPFFRVKAAKVSQLLDLVGELSLVATDVTHHPDLAGLELEGYAIAAHHLEMLVRELQDLAGSLRLVPFNRVSKRVQRLVHDLAHQTGKEIDLVLEGADTEIDRVLIDQLHDPLMHIVRNAVDHGLESREERLAAGKPGRGKIVVAVHQQGQEIKITVFDDGRGLDRERILAKARQRGLIGPHENPDDAVVWNYIFQSGLSTAREISNLSGRGVGMDVVQATLRRLRGRATVHSQPGQNTCITLHIPLTLAFLDSMIVRQQKQLFAIPIDVVSEVVKPTAAQVVQTAANHGELLRLRDEMVPVCRLQKFFHQADEPGPLDEQLVVVVETSTGPLGLAVDEVIDQQQVTMKSLEGQLKDIRAGAGCVLLGTGDVAVALDCEQLAHKLVAIDYG